LIIVIDDQYFIHWTLHGNSTISIKLRAKCTGWVGFMLGSNNVCTFFGGFRKFLNRIGFKHAKKILLHLCLEIFV